MSKSIQIVCFDNPYPPNYGGTIDVFYKIKALYAKGIDVYLHFYVTKQSDRTDTKPLEKYCKQIYTYKRNTTLLSHLSLKPFSVKSRSSKGLVQCLVKIGFPVLYEGLNTTATLKVIAAKGQKTYVRLHNIEHNYFKNIGDLEYSFFKKVYYNFEAWRLKKYQSQLKFADILFSISLNDQKYFSNLFRDVRYLPVFQSKTELQESKSQEYCLFHGDLRLSDNIRAADFLIDFFSSKPNRKLIIASSFDNAMISQRIANANNITFKIIESLQDLEQLFAKTAIHILISYQASGIKLKLLNALHTNTVVLVNKYMIEGTGLESCCELFNNESELNDKVEKFYGMPISLSQRTERMKVLSEFNPNNSIDLLIECL